MKKIVYPSQGSNEWTKLTQDYKLIFSRALPSMEQLWADWKLSQGVDTIPETVEDLLIADARVLADVYNRFKARRIKLSNGRRGRNPILQQLDDIFKYTGGYDDQIAKFFTDRADELKISTCFYCESAYINVFSSPRKRQFDIDHFLPKQKCPILGLSLFNFVPSCQVCNSRIKLSREVGNNPNEWEELNPTSDKYEFDQNVKIRLRMHHGPDTTFKKKGEYYLYFLCKGVYQKEVDLFHLEERYEFHKLEAMRIKQLKERYPLSARRKIARMLGVTEIKVREDLFHVQFLKNNHRCFSKLTEDMLGNG